MRCVYDDGVGTSLHQRLHAFQSVLGDAYAGSHTQTTFLVLARHWLVLRLRYVLICYKSHQVVIFIHYWKFLNFVLLKNLCCSVKVCLLRRCHQVLRCHHLVNLLVVMALKAQVAVSNDTHQVVLVVNNGNTANMVFSHHRQRIGNSLTATYCHGVINHTVLRTLHNSHLACLSLYRHILVNNTNTALTSYSYRHSTLRNGVHSSRNKGNVKTNVSRELCFQLNGPWKHIRVSRNEQHVVERQTVHHNFFFCK